MKTLTANQILSSYPTVNKEGRTFSKWYSHLQNAKKQHGTRIEKIEAVMPYIKFNSIIEEDECFNYLMENL